MHYLGVRPGSVTPLALLNDHGGAVRIALDAGLRDSTLWNFHPLTNTMTTALAPADMLRFLASIDHVPTWVDFDGMRIVA